MLVDLSKMQEEEFGDGTTTVVVLVGELLKQAEKLIDQGVPVSTITKGFELAKSKTLEVLDDIAFDADKEELINIARTSMSGKGSFTNLDSMAENLVTVLLNVAENGEIDKDMIKLRKIHGEGTADTEITESVSVDKSVLESEMPRDINCSRLNPNTSSL
jgi:chaperonin GroEL (HSP60 family)